MHGFHASPCAACILAQNGEVESSFLQSLAMTRERSKVRNVLPSVVRDFAGQSAGGAGSWKLGFTDLHVCPALTELIAEWLPIRPGQEDGFN